ncbi:MAG: ATP-binding protein, partial [Oligoflexia bacterium]|nr:ATP-binding protein [Oligoflexia bacterium]
TGKVENKEIDFIAEKNSEKKYIQVAYLLPDQATMDREFGNLEIINDHYEKTVISMDDVVFNNKNGIKHLQAWNFVD